MQPKVGIGILVISNEKILLGKRKKALGQGTWAVPGGHLEVGETVEACTKRELFEETNLIAEEIIQGPWMESLTPEHYIDILTMVTKFRGELINREPEKKESWEWFSLDQLPHPLFETLEKIKVENSLIPFLRKNSLSYLSAPFSDPDPAVQKERYEQITAAAGVLIKQGTYVYSPITHNIPIKELGVITSWEDWKPYDFAMLTLCRQLIVYQLPGWEKSQGVQEEIAFAQEKNIPIIEMKPLDLVSFSS